MFVIREQHSTPDMGWLAGAFCLGMACGAAVMYLLEPDAGRRHRALMRDQMVHAGHQIGDLGGDARGKAMDMRNRAQGMAHESRRNVSELAGTGN